MAVINATMARRYFLGKDPIGQRILIQEIVPGKTQLGEEIPWEVVGVVANETVGSLDDNADDNPGMYVSNEQSPVYYQVRAPAQRHGHRPAARDPSRRPSTN